MYTLFFLLYLFAVMETHVMGLELAGISDKD